jgi:hypothetical protein
MRNARDGRCAPALRLGPAATFVARRRQSASELKLRQACGSSACSLATFQRNELGDEIRTRRNSPTSCFGDMFVVRRLNFDSIRKAFPLCVGCICVIRLGERRETKSLGLSNADGDHGSRSMAPYFQYALSLKSSVTEDYHMTLSGKPCEGEANPYSKNLQVTREPLLYDGKVDTS